jgi:hypothetical protein
MRRAGALQFALIACGESDPSVRSDWAPEVQRLLALPQQLRSRTYVLLVDIVFHFAFTFWCFLLKALKLSVFDFLPLTPRLAGAS